MPDDLVDILDPVSFKPNGKIVLKSVARKENLLYAVVHLWIFNSKGDILLQHRCKEKKLYPNMWDIGVAGGVNANESPIDAVVREAKEEIGLIIPQRKLKEAFTFNEKYVFNGMKINEHAHVFLYEFNGDINLFNLQKEEVDSVKFFSIKEIKRILKEKPSDHLVWDIKATPKVISLIENFINLK